MRASGSHSNRYGSIEDLVVGVRLVSPARVINVQSSPRDAHGPSLKELVLGSEGALGVITQATLRVRPLPALRRFASLLFSSVPDGVAALRAMAREDALPDMAYLADSEETKFAAAGEGISPDADGIAGRRLAEGSLLLMGFEGTKERVTHRRRLALRHARANSTSLGAGPAERWSHERFELPYLPRVIGEDGLVVLRALKRELDPDGIMNPGTLVTGST